HRYLELNPPPIPSDWSRELEPVRRTRRGLEALYSFFRRTAPMFEKIYRDVGESAALAKVMGDFDTYLRSVADDLADAWPRDKRGSRRTILRHAAKFATWQSLQAERVDDAGKAALILQWLSNPLR